MTAYTQKIRLFVSADLNAKGDVELNRDQAHYLHAVLRRAVGDELRLFNGRDGEWRARIDSLGKNKGLLVLVEQTAAQPPATDLWLVFAPIKRARIDFLAEKATELGASRLIPTMTRHTAVERVNLDRMRANAIEAAEQCGILAIPEIAEPTTLSALLDTWPQERRLLHMDETGGGRPISEVAAEAAKDGAPPAPCAILIGPEGGFAVDEINRLNSLPFVTTVGLGPRIYAAIPPLWLLWLAGKQPPETGAALVRESVED